MLLSHRASERLRADVDRDAKGLGERTHGGLLDRTKRGRARGRPRTATVVGQGGEALELLVNRLGEQDRDRAARAAPAAAASPGTLTR
jgi:hypothetical protein